MQIAAKLAGVSRRCGRQPPSLVTEIVVDRRHPFTDPRIKSVVEQAWRLQVRVTLAYGTVWYFQGGMGNVSIGTSTPETLTLSDLIFGLGDS